MLIRKAEVKDATSIAQISVETWKDTYKGLIDETILYNRKVDDKRISGWVENIKNPDFTILVYEDKEILGYLWAGPARDKQEIKNELYAIYIKISAQRKGIGKYQHVNSLGDRSACGQRLLFQPQRFHQSRFAFGA